MTICEKLGITFVRPKVKSSNVPKPKDIQFLLLYDKEKQQILPFEKLNPENE